MTSSARVALISDIHGNLAALEAVLGDIAACGVERIWCLGDIVGYGPQPRECLDRVIRVCEPHRAILGNHDWAVLKEPVGFNPTAREAAVWSKGVLKPNWPWGEKRRQWRWLDGLPNTFHEGDLLFVHASPRHPLEEYILEEHTRGISMTGEDPQQLLDENLALVNKAGFVGHTHRPGVLQDDRTWRRPESCGLRWHLQDGRRTIVNIGSVGQPRDGDPRACYAILDLDSHEIEWRRVAYDVETTCRLIREHPRLDDKLADRLRIGK